MIIPLRAIGVKPGRCSRKQRSSTSAALAIVLLASVSATPSAPVMADEAIDALVSAYPDHLAGSDENSLIWKDGARQPIRSDRVHPSFDDLLNHPSIEEQFAIPYRLGRIEAEPATNEDPGRIRNEQFFTKMYGDCRDPKVSARMKTIHWLPNHHGGKIRATTVNDIAHRLEKISSELERLPPAVLKYAAPSAGAFNCRAIAGTNRVSMHSYGAAIDVNATLGRYWRWSMKDGRFVWRNDMPYEIVEIFERNGFIWGGKWYHFDMMHFEYRPEIIDLARKNWAR